MLRPGIVLEETGAAQQSSQKPVLQEGDILLSWTRGDAHGEFESPLSFWWLYLEQRPLGVVSVQGLRSGEVKTWTLGINDFYSKTGRPNFTGVWLTRYESARKLARAGRVAAAASQWLAMARSIPTEHAWVPAWLCFRAAGILAARRLWKQADRAYVEAVRRAGDDVALLVPIHRAWAWSLQRQEQSSKADEHYLKVLPEVEKAGRDLVAAELLNILSENATIQGNFLQGREYARAALLINENLAPEGDKTAWSLTNLGDAALGSGDLDEADTRYGSALKIYRALALDSRVALTLVYLANVAMTRADLAAADKYLTEALAIETRNGNFSTDALAGLGWLALNRGDIMRAKQFFQRIREFHMKQKPGSRELATDLLNLSDVYRAQGDLNASERSVRQAWIIARRIDSHGGYAAGVLGHLGEIAAARGRTNEAERLLRQSLALVAESEIDALWILDVAERLECLGNIAQHRRNFKQAERYYGRAAKMLGGVASAGAHYAENLAGMANVARLEGKLEAARRCYEDALKALEGQTGRLGGSSEVRAGFRARHENIYRQYIDLLVSLNEPELAFEVLEHSRARTLLETLAVAHIDILQGVDAELLGKERSLQATFKAKSERRIRLLNDKHGQGDAELKIIEKEISDLTSAYQDIEAQIRSSSPVYAALTQPQPLSAKAIQEQLLDPDTLLLEYSLGEERSHVFVVSDDSLKAIELPRRSTVETASRRLYELLTERNLRKKDESPAERLARLAHAEAEYPAAAVRLSRMVLGPVAKQLAGKRLLIVSDGALHYVPFAALPVTVSGKASAPLAAQHEIINLPSASVLAVLRHERMGREPAAKIVAVLADPVFNAGDARVKHVSVDGRRSLGNGVSGSEGSSLIQEESEGSLAFAHLTRSVADVSWRGRRRGEVYLPRLRFSRQEAEAIAAVTPPGQVLEALDFQASRATAINAELAGYRIVHFATHALLNSRHPELSGLVLSLVDERGRPQNGFFDLQDIYNLNLPAELVVLSACETGLGKEISGEGLVGLTRGFMYAGASRVMASLWKIDDQATAELMKHFYQAMLVEGMRPAAALREAQLNIREDKRWSSPYFWAAFQIQGEWK